MFSSKKAQENLRYCPENHRQYGDYATNWNTGMRYVVTEGMIILEGGTLLLTTNGQRDVYIRDSMRRNYDLDIKMLSELPKLYDPRTKKPVTKRSLLSEMYLVEHETCRVYSLPSTTWNSELSGHRCYASWPCVGAMFHGNTVLSTTQRNVKREKAWLLENASFVARCEAVYALEGAPTTYSRSARQLGDVTKAVVAVGKASLTPDDMYNVGAVLISQRDEFLLRLTADKINYDYLTTTPTAL